MGFLRGGCLEYLFRTSRRLELLTQVGSMCELCSLRLLTQVGSGCGLCSRRLHSPHPLPTWRTAVGSEESSSGETCIVTFKRSYHPGQFSCSREIPCKEIVILATVYFILV